MGTSLRLFVHGLVTSNLQNWEAPFLFGNIQSLPPGNGGSREKSSTSPEGIPLGLTEPAVDDFAARIFYKELTCTPPLNCNIQPQTVTIIKVSDTFSDLSRGPDYHSRIRHFF